MDSVKQDLVYAWRNLRKSPGYAAVTVLTLALGIGANTAIFSVVNGVLLKPLPYPAPGQLYFITSQFPSLGFDQFWVSAPEFIEFRDRTQAFARVGAYQARAVNLGMDDQPRRVNSALVTSELMPVLGVEPVRGRVFTLEDTLPGAEPVAILSSELWRSAFAGEESALGREILVNGIKTRIVGIMPAGYDIHDQRVLLWEPLTLNPTAPGNRGGHFLYLVGRLKEGVTPGQASADVESMLARWPELNPGTHVPNPTTHRIRLDRLQDDMVGGMRTALWVLQGAVAFVLLIACANLANLLLARAESRQKEFAIRSALGAGRARLLRQFLTEGLVLAFAGGVVGALLGLGGLRAMLAANPDSLPRTGDITLDPVVLLFTVAISLLTGVVFGLAPLLNLREQVVNVSLKEAGQRTTAGAARARVRSGLVMVEVALAVVLVIGAGLLLRSFWNLLTVDAGFNRSRLVTFGLVLPQATYREPQQVVDFFSRLSAQLAAVPGVQSVAAMTGLPPSRNVNANDTDFEGYTAPKEGPFENVDYYQTVTPGYLTTMGIPLLDGRDFQLSDATGAPVVLVNETLVRTFYKGESPIGRRLRRGFNDKVPWFTIVGVVRDVKQGGVDEKTGTEIYFLADQAPRAALFGVPRNMNIVVRSTLPIASLGSDIRRLVHGADPTLPIIRLRTMDEVFADTISRPRFLAQLLGIFAGVALALAAIGTYGILSYSVSERRREIGIHMALGATRGSVLRMILWQGFRLTIAGLVAGVAASLALTRLLQTQLFNVRPSDPATMVAVVGAIAMVALAACYVPASRAMRVDPMVVLRDE
jgi:putative ABC transport system permease protein